jgi:hypothetical protein
VQNLRALPLQNLGIKKEQIMWAHDLLKKGDDVI